MLFLNVIFLYLGRSFLSVFALIVNDTNITFAYFFPQIFLWNFYYDRHIVYVESLIWNIHAQTNKAETNFILYRLWSSAYNIYC